jgi:hypothetical protein
LTTTTARRTREDGTQESSGSSQTAVSPADEIKPKRTLKEKKREQKAAATEMRTMDVRTASDSTATPPPISTTETAPRPKRVLKLKQYEPAKHPTSSDQIPTKKEKEHWQTQKEALREKFPEGWNPRKKLSPDALAGIRALHQQFPEEYTTDVLADKFEVSPEAIRRILKSKWEPNPDEEIERQERWFNRGKKIWATWAELGKKPPERWRKEGITRSPEFHEQRKARAKARSRLARTLM